LGKKRIEEVSLDRLLARSKAESEPAYDGGSSQRKQLERAVSGRLEKVL
jgi:hypothetical protein